MSRSTPIESGRTSKRRDCVAEELPIVAEHLYFLPGRAPIGGKHVHDAKIVSTRIAYNLAGFKRFSGFIDVAENL